MSKTIIRAKNLGKRYLINHQKKERYVTLRDGLTRSTRKLRDTIFHSKKEYSQSKEEFWAIDDISFEVEKGDRVGIIGRNGAGKSTLLKVLSRITEPTTGYVELKGRVASLLEVGTGFHPELTGRENIFLNGAVLGMSRVDISRRFDEIVDFAEVERFLDTPVKRYSSGMYVRLAFAVAAHLEPEILVVDEVLAVGDIQFQKKCLGKMESVAEKDGRTVLFVSHNMAAINNLCHKGILLSHGKVLAQGSIEQVINQYISSKEDIASEYQWHEEQKSDNDCVRLISAKILSDGQVSEKVDIAKEVSIEVTYKNLQDEVGLYTSIHLKDSFGNDVLASVNFPSGTLEEDEYACKKLKKGKYCSRCVLPKNFLNNTTYTVSILILRHDMSVVVMREEILKFTGIDTGEMSKEFSGHWIGSIRPKLSWKTTHLQ